VFRIHGEVVIRRPVEEVFDFAVDARNEPRYNHHMLRAEKITSGPVGAGTQFRAEIDSMGHTIPMVTDITACERPRRYTSSTHMSFMDTFGTVTFEPVPGGTRLRWSWVVEPRGAFRFVAPLFAPLGRRQEYGNWAGLKRLLETSALHRYAS